MKAQRIDTRPWGVTENGIVVVDKPQGWTSHDVVGKVRSLAKNRKVGHAGTLDPMATGVLVLGIGKGTKLLQYIVDAPKTYAATVRLGIATSTEDAEGDITSAPGCAPIDIDTIRGAARGFIGEISQVPSAVSAIKVDGRRAYDRVRAGEDVQLAARPVTIHGIEVYSATPGIAAGGEPVLDVEMTVECGAGTYIRALGRDLARTLGTEGHLTSLRRVRVGGFTADAALTIDRLVAATERDLLLPVIGLGEAAASVLPVRTLTAQERAELGFGRTIAPTGRGGVVAGLDEAGTLFALVQDERRRGELSARPIAVLGDTRG